MTARVKVWNSNASNIRTIGMWSITKAKAVRRVPTGRDTNQVPSYGHRAAGEGYICIYLQHDVYRILLLRVINTPLPR